MLVRLAFHVSQKRCRSWWIFNEVWMNSLPGSFLWINLVGFPTYFRNVRRPGSRRPNNNNNNGDRSRLVTTSKPSRNNGSDCVTVHMFSFRMLILTDRLVPRRKRSRTFVYVLTIQSSHSSISLLVVRVCFTNSI
jgi:hypothetical protein